MRTFKLRKKRLRKYLTPDERNRFKEATSILHGEYLTFCLTLFYTGCRITEALELPLSGVDTEEKVLVFETLKQRDSEEYREVPIPDHFIQLLKKTHDFHQEGDPLLWSFCRRTGYRIIKRVMKKANISGIHACPKGLRHSFGIAHAYKKTSPNKIQKWLGHSSLEVTMIYVDAVGLEDREMASAIW